MFRAAISQVMKGLPTEPAKNAVSCQRSWWMNRDEGKCCLVKDLQSCSHAMIIASTLVMDLRL